LSLAIVLVALPVHVAGSAADVARAQGLFAAAWLAGMAAIAWGYRRLRDRPFVVRAFGRERTLDLEWFASWFLGRRVWLTVGVMFHVHLLVLMNIGMFAPIMLL